jgi:hypothetical protein
MRLEYERNLLRLQREEIRLRATLRWCLAVGARQSRFTTSPSQEQAHINNFCTRVQVALSPMPR